MTVPFVHSSYERVEDDDYQTIDPRCVRALTDLIFITKDSYIVDCCSPNGSGIVDGLISLGYSMSEGYPDAFGDFVCDWNIFNPPYTRKLVDKIVRKQIDNLQNNKFHGMAILVRNGFDFAKSRYDMFTHKYYYGTVKMMFRPWWFEHKKAQPIHNYVWHVWKRGNQLGLPVTHYWKEDDK